MGKIKVNAVIFDYGNTLVHEPFSDVLRLKLAEFQNELRKFGYKIKRKDIFDKWNEANKNINYPHISHFAQEEPIIEDAIKRLGIDGSCVLQISKRFLFIYREGYEQIYSKNPRKKEIKSTLDYLRKNGKKLSVLSNGRYFDVKRAMELYGVYDLFDFIIASESVGAEKPDPLIFSMMLQKIKESPQDVLYVGDDPVRDLASKKLGMKAILYVPPKKYRKSAPWRRYELSPIKPDAVITKISQLKDIVI